MVSAIENQTSIVTGNLKNLIATGTGREMKIEPRDILQEAIIILPETTVDFGNLMEDRTITKGPSEDKKTVIGQSEDTTIMKDLSETRKGILTGMTDPTVTTITTVVAEDHITGTADKTGRLTGRTDHLENQATSNLSEEMTIGHNVSPIIISPKKQKINRSV
jgi:hypothetical protein